MSLLFPAGQIPDGFIFFGIEIYARADEKQDIYFCWPYIVRHPHWEV